MPDSIVGLLDKADLAVASASLLADESVTAPVAASAAMLRRRLDYPEDLLLVGVAGGTGSGKSSLVNAIAGFDVAVVGGLRPTTDRPMAVASSRSAKRIEGYLAVLGIDDVAVAEIPDWLCIIDLPDTDSVELGHRLQVESLVPRLDVVVWVVDPEKYRDSSLHHGYIAPLSAHAHRFVFVLNQMDRLSVETGTMVLSDFRRALIDDGIELPAILATAADPVAGPPSGVEELVDQLRSRTSTGVIAKALDDIQEAASALVSALGPPDLDFDVRASAAIEEAARSIGKIREAEATDRLMAFLEAVAGEAGGVTGERIRSAAARVPRQIRQIVEDLGRRPDLRSLDALGEVVPDGESDEAVAMAVILDRVIVPVREMVRERASALALATDLSLSAAAARSRMGV